MNLSINAAVLYLVYLDIQFVSWGFTIIVGLLVLSYGVLKLMFSCVDGWGAGTSWTKMVHDELEPHRLLGLAHRSNPGRSQLFPRLSDPPRQILGAGSSGLGCTRTSNGGIARAAVGLCSPQMPLLANTQNDSPPSPPQTWSLAEKMLDRRKKKYPMDEPHKNKKKHGTRKFRKISKKSPFGWWPSQGPCPSAFPRCSARSKINVEGAQGQREGV